MPATNKLKSPKQDWQILEELVASIQKQLAPEAIVEHNVLVRGKITGVERQVDILVTQMIGQYKMTIAIDCKDTKRPVDTKGVGEFSELVRDIEANKGVLVCPAGFSKPALKTAKSYQLELYRPVDTGNHKWKIRASIPALCDFRTAEPSATLGFSAPNPFTSNTPIEYWNIFDSNGKEIGTPKAEIIAGWNAGRFPIEPGPHTQCLIFGERETLVDDGFGTLVPVTLYIDYRVQQTLYYGQIPIEKVSGFLDEHTGHVVTNSFTIGLLTPSEVRGTWGKLGLGDSPPIAPVFRLVGLDLLEK